MLLLDEPTNHLDIDAVEWLENLLSYGGVLLVSRPILNRVTTRIVELRGGMAAESKASSILLTLTKKIAARVLPKGKKNWFGKSKKRKLIKI